MWRRRGARKEAACDVAKTFLGDFFSNDSRTMISPVLLPNSIRIRMASSHRHLFSFENARTFRGLRQDCKVTVRGNLVHGAERAARGEPERPIEVTLPSSGATCPPRRNWHPET